MLVALEFGFDRPQNMLGPQIAHAELRLDRSQIGIEAHRTGRFANERPLEEHIEIRREAAAFVGDGKAGRYDVELAGAVEAARHRAIAASDVDLRAADERRDAMAFEWRRL